MDTLLKYTIFQDVYFPKIEPKDENQATDLVLRRSIRHKTQPLAVMSDLPYVVFDFETTGLDSAYDQIIEIGAQKIFKGKVIGEFSTFVLPDRQLEEQITKITGITQEMLEGAPKIPEVLPKFLDFIQGCVLVAHNATFDMGFLKNQCHIQHLDFEWSAFCTLKMARDFFPNIESRSLDGLANYYGLTFESRHRSIGDVKVTVSVLKNMLTKEGKHLRYFKDFSPYLVE